MGAGTVEFIMDAETGEYFFMEMYVFLFFKSSILSQEGRGKEENVRQQREERSELASSEGGGIMTAMG